MEVFVVEELDFNNPNSLINEKTLIIADCIENAQEALKELTE